MKLATFLPPARCARPLGARQRSLPRPGRDGFHSVPDFRTAIGDAVERVPAKTRRAFTLIEMLVVMAIIVVLAGLTIGGFGMIKKKTRIARVQGELARLQTAIESYKQSLGFYPPDNDLREPPGSGTRHPLSPAAPPLFYELSGTVIVGPNYQTLDGNEVIHTNLIQQYFGRAGFANASVHTNQVKTFLPAIKESQYKEGFQGVDVELLVAPVEGPVLSDLSADKKWRLDPDRVNPFNYVSSKPVHNPGEFDLWTDLRIGSKYYRISNWAEPEEIKP